MIKSKYAFRMLRVKTTLHFIINLCHHSFFIQPLFELQFKDSHHGTQRWSVISVKAFQPRLCPSVQCRFAKTPDAHPSLLLHPPFRSQSKPNDARARARARPAFKGIFICSIASNNQNTTERRCLKFKVMLLRGTGKLRRKFCFAAAVVLLQRGVTPQLHLWIALIRRRVDRR